MDFPTGNIKRIYFRYLSAAFGSAMRCCSGVSEVDL